MLKRKSHGRKRKKNARENLALEPCSGRSVGRASVRIHENARSRFHPQVDGRIDERKEEEEGRKRRGLPHTCLSAFLL